ncbi:MAG: hypothetical protein QW091_00375 [Candidatus Micrarchaeaceae archaeon]
MALDEVAKAVVERGYYEARVNIAGIIQKVRFDVIKKTQGHAYMALHTDKLVGFSDLVKIAESAHLPAESPNGKAFPKGKMSKDFQEEQ